MGVTAFLSMWISNTATTAMMVPIVQAVLDQLHSKADSEYSLMNQKRIQYQQEQSLILLQSRGKQQKLQEETVRETIPGPAGPGSA